MKKAAAVPALALLCACASLDAPPPPPKGAAGGLPSVPALAPGAPSQEAEKILAEYTKRFSEGYPLYPGDRIKFLFVSRAELTFTAAIPAEGYITFPMIGKLPMAGRTIDQVQTELRQRLSSGYLTNPDLSVLVEEYAKKSVYVLGAVGQPKDYEIPSGRPITLMQALSQAYGLKPESEKHAVVIFRRKGTGSAERLAIPVNLLAITQGKAEDPIVLPDDVIHVPTREKVFIFGQVVRPGEFVVAADAPTTVTQAVAMAGGFTRVAAESDIRLIRRLPDGTRVAYGVNVGRVLGGHATEDPLVQPGDVIYVPESYF